MNDHFEFAAWDHILSSGFDVVLYSVVLKKPIGGFSIGAEFDQAMFLFSRCEMVLLDRDQVEYRFVLGVSIGDAIK